MRDHILTEVAAAIPLMPKDGDPAAAHRTALPRISRREI
jgi:hypothetical protein